VRRQILPIDLEANTIDVLDARSGSLSHRAQAMILATASENTAFAVSLPQLKTMVLRPTSVSLDPRVITILKQASDRRQIRHPRRIVIYAAHTPVIASRYLQVMSLSAQALEALIEDLYKVACTPTLVPDEAPSA